MNPTTKPLIPQLQSPLPPQPHHHSTYYDRHPDEKFISFYPSNLLRAPHQSRVEPSTNGTSSFHKCSTTATTIKDIFKPPFVATAPSLVELCYRLLELTMKDHVDLDLSPKKTSSGRELKKEIVGSF
ncbi:hypothetical protein SAY87_030343 [Trapa incisa]|uniref:Uncharacterized protein n=1 Tax=Trapa incisa TaxID=236973 RepID=A0AAN7KM92_9MYRT|nr:hypothetical protein SAY87_030343 [Trapa incisa]